MGGLSGGVHSSWWRIVPLQPATSCPRERSMPWHPDPSYATRAHSSHSGSTRRPHPGFVRVLDPVRQNSRYSASEDRVSDRALWVVRFTKKLNVQFHDFFFLSYVASRYDLLQGFCTWSRPHRELSPGPLGSRSSCFRAGSVLGRYNVLFVCTVLIEKRGAGTIRFSILMDDRDR